MAETVYNLNLILIVKKELITVVLEKVQDVTK